MRLKNFFPSRVNLKPRSEKKLFLSAARMMFLMSAAVPNALELICSRAAVINQLLANGAAISFLQFIGIVIDFGLVPVTAQMMSEKDFDKEKLFRNLLGFRFLTSVLFLSFFT